MDYRRSVVLGIRFFQRLVAILALFYFGARLLGIGPAWLRTRHDPPWLFALLALGLVLSFVEQKLRDDRPPPWLPSPAVSGTATVVATGIAATVATGWHARTLTDFMIPLAMLASTAILAPLVYRFARRNADRIGEAQFETPPNPK